MNIVSKSLDINGIALTLETGKLAQQATAAVLARMGDTVVLVTVVEGKIRTDIDYFPLSVEYVERLYAGGRIKGSRWVKREGRPSDDAILRRRLIDRSIRPLFPKEYKNEVQIVITLLSVDGINEPDILGIVATSAALHMSHIPWKGPISAVRMGYVTNKETHEGEFLINPGGAGLDVSELDVVASQSKEKTLMLEAGALQVSEDVMIEAIKRAHDINAKLLDFIEDFAKEAREREKVTVSSDELLLDAIKKAEKYKDELEAFIALRAHKESGSSSQDAIIEKIITEAKIANPETKLDKKIVAQAVEKVFFKLIRSNILEKSKRPDGRKLDEIRPVSVAVGVLPRVHGSGLFQRGDTQGLTIATLGSGRMGQLIESAEGEEEKRYIHHYYMPPYSVGETGRIGTPSSREIGHGALAERALLGVIPAQNVFPYTIRLVSEILSSNGSTSMAATCGSTLALMDAGVPIIKPVAGIAMGMMSKNYGQKDEQYVILTDIIGLEDFSGDMDFKVAGTDSGITAIQLDVKHDGLTIKMIEEIFERAKTARLAILEKMLAILPQSRKTVSSLAPKISVLNIPVDRIGELIGPGGRNIKNIIATTGAQVDVEDDGTVSVSGPTDEEVQQAVAWITGMTREVTVGEEFEGEVKRILPFGAFVEFLPGKEGMVHVSKMSTAYINNPSDVVSVGQKVKVRVIEVDEQGRINLSMLSPEQMREQASYRDHKPNGRTQPHPLTRQFQREQRGGRQFTPRNKRDFRK
ncbi:MAG TPA: polyribonucleotide nucleotidyltransferase [Patescibacteria group bacterium]|nr:polyribonucleotide nucleotidyltransferase [Patescibacteria group bacterium]